MSCFAIASIANAYACDDAISVLPIIAFTSTFVVVIVVVDVINVMSVVATKAALPLVTSAMSAERSCWQLVLVQEWPWL